MSSPIKREVQIGDCRLLLGDCLEILPLLGNVDAVVTDPPYGIGADGKSFAVRGNKNKSDYFNKTSTWDAERPSRAVFECISKLAARQIIWGGNYFTDYLTPSMGWLIWDKGQREFSLADCEMAWCSWNRAARIFDLPRSAATHEGRVHPTQKPIELMKWCLGFLPDAHTILDPFMGSGTTGVACVKLGRKFIGIEIDEGYFEIACKRIRDAYAQPDLFIEAEKPKTEQLTLGMEAAK